MYAFIAVLSTIASATALYFALFRRNHNDPPKLQKIAIETSVIFWDTLLWYGIMACIAGLIYYTSKAKSLYEFTISILVVLLILNAGLMLLTLYIYGIEDLGDSETNNIRIVLQAIIYLLAVTITSGSLVRIQHMDVWGTSYIGYASLRCRFMASRKAQSGVGAAIQHYLNNHRQRVLRDLFVPLNSTRRDKSIADSSSMVQDGICHRCNEAHILCSGDPRIHSRLG